MYNDNQKEEYIKLITEHLANINDEKFLRRIYISVRDYVNSAEREKGGAVCQTTKN